jgi:hypothetical protein
MRAAPALLAAALVMLPLPPAQAQAAPGGNAVQRGVNAAMVGRCRTDVLQAEQVRSAAALSVLSPAAVQRLVPATDEMGQLMLMCAHQLHQHRCSAKIVALAGDILGLPPDPTKRPDAGAVFGGVAGGLAGALTGGWVGPKTAAVGGAVGIYKGSQAGSALLNGGAAGACLQRQRQLAAASLRVLGPLGHLSHAGLTAALERSVRQRSLALADAQALADDAARLADRAGPALQALQ